MPSLSALARYARFLGLRPAQIAAVALRGAIARRLIELGDDRGVDQRLEDFAKRK